MEYIRDKSHTLLQRYFTFVVLGVTGSIIFLVAVVISIKFHMKLEKESLLLFIEDTTREKAAHLFSILDLAEVKDLESFTSADLAMAIDHIKEDFRIVQFNVINLEGMIVWSTDPDVLGKMNHYSLIFQKAQRSTMASRYRDNRTFRDMPHPISVVETYMPLKNDRGNIIGVIEFYKDISEHHPLFDKEKALITRTMLITLGLFFLPLLMVSLIVDETRYRASRERRLAEEALRKSEENYQTLVETIPHGIQENGLSGIITFHNRAYAKMNGYAEGELQGKAIWDVLASETGRDELRTYLATLVEEQPAPTPYVTQNRTRDGRVIDVQVDWDYKRDEQGSIRGFVSVHSDITERKQAEEQIKRHSIMLEQAVQETTHKMEALMERVIRQEKLAVTGQISGSIAHELRNPLGTIKQSMFYLKRLYHNRTMDAANPKVHEHLELIEAEIARADRVITDLLATTGTRPGTPVPLDLRAMMLDAAQQCPFGDRVQLTIDCDPDPFVLWAEPSQIRQVFVNVLTNAVEACTSSGTVTVRARVLAHSGHCQIEIHDTGCGIAAQDIDNVFEPLFTRKATGNGLGLSICKQIMERHGGRITVSSAVDHGTTVSLLLPSQPVSDTTAQTVHR